MSVIACLRQLSLCRFGGLCEHGAVPKRLIRGVIKAVAGIAVVVFILARFTTNTGVLLFVGSIVVLLICFGLLKLLEGDDENTGYWSLTMSAMSSSFRAHFSMHSLRSAISERIKATNRTFEDHWAFAITIRNGKVTNIREYVDTQALARASETAASLRP
jgi:hypothetical protein